MRMEEPVLTGSYPVILSIRCYIQGHDKGGEIMGLDVA